MAAVARSLAVVLAAERRSELGISENAKGYYPAVLEYGSKNNPAYPYLRPALAEKAASVIKDASQAIASGVEREAKR